MQIFSKYIVLFILLVSGMMLLYRVFHKLTKVNSKLSQIKIEPYYLMHKDSTHYAVTFKVDNFNDRLGIYIGAKKQLLNNKVINLLDSNKFYALLIDETVPSYDGMNLGVRKIILNGKTIYKESQLVNLFGGCISLILTALVFINNRKRPKNDS